MTPTNLKANVRNAFGLPIVLPLISGRTNTGLILDATGGAGLFKIVNTTGTSTRLAGVAAQNTTKTDIVIFETVLPKTYKPSTRIIVRVNARHVEVAGTALVNTILAKAYKLAATGASGSDLIAGSATAIGTTATDTNIDFTIPATAALQPGDRLLIQITSVATEGGDTGTTTNSLSSITLV